ncbi:MAG: chloride channel protein [Anaerolineales bacterium]|nr:chloride channel protein [Anaerolineales bacterium]
MRNPRNPLEAALDRLRPSETAILLATAVAVGGGTGLGAVLFIRLIAAVQSLFFDSGADWFGGLGGGWAALVPVLGGLAAGPIIAFLAKEAKGHGVPEVMQAIALRGGRIRPRVVLAKLAASALCLGSGGSAGREGPIVQVGAALGSSIGQWLGLSENRIRNLVACGAAAGIAATFNAPIAGVLFAMEIILGELHLGDLGNVVVSSVTAATLGRIFLGDRPAFAIPNYGVRSPWEILLYVLLGVLSAVCAVFFIRLLYWFEDRFDGWRFPDWLKPAVGGGLLGALALAYPLVLRAAGAPASELPSGPLTSANLPQIFGSGFSVIEQSLTAQLPLGVLLALALLKPLATSLTLGSGNSGGVFAPSLFTGAVLGGAFGLAVERLAPGATAGAGAFAVVGMAAVFAGAARAPFTAIVIVFEMTNDYRMIVPLMAGVIVSLIAAEKLHPESIYTLKLTRRGIRLRRGKDIDVMEAVRVDEVMVRDPFTVPAALPAGRLAEEFIRTGRHGFPVVHPDGALFGVVSLEDYRSRIAGSPERAEQLTAGEIASTDLVTVFPDDSVGTALQRMAPRDLSRLPVVARDDPRRLMGVVRRNDIVRAYEVGVARREELRNRSEVARKFERTAAGFIDFAVGAGSPALGKRIAELALPREAVLVSIRRGRGLVIPHGDTRLQEGDVVTALCEHESAKALTALF